MEDKAYSKVRRGFLQNLSHVGLLTVCQVPDVAPHIERSRPVTRLGNITAHPGRKAVVLEKANSFREQTSTDEEQHGGRANQEPVESSAGTSLVDGKADNDTGNDANDDGDRDGDGRLAKGDLYVSLQSLSLYTKAARRASYMKARRSGKTYTSNKDDRFKTLTQHSDKGQQKQRPLAPASFPLVPVRLGTSNGLALGLIESGSQLETPLDASAVHLEKGNAHEVDDDRGDERKDAFPDLFGLGPEVGQLGVELDCQYLICYTLV